jgi:DNA-binding transcriptional MerR regulator
MDGAGYTLREIARELNLPESTIRYYRDAFAPFIPTVGLGRRRRYPADAVDVFRTIADGYSQNLSREEIEANLPGPVAQTIETRPASLRLHRQVPAPVSAPPTDQIIAMLESERERRDVMWQLAREIVRMGETLERQQLTLMQITHHLEWGASRALPPVPGLPVPYTGTPATPEPARPDEQELARELGSLREELQRERELVERLRRAKLEIERRATNAERELEHRAQSSDMGALRRFLSKDER